MENKVRGWIEVVQDFVGLVGTALATPKGQELMDEVLQMLELPDLLPGIDGLESDNSATPAQVSGQDVLSVIQKSRGVAFAQRDAEAETVPASQPQPLTHAQIKAIRAAKKAQQ